MHFFLFWILWSQWCFSWKSSENEWSEPVNVKRLIPICCRLVDARPVHRSSRCRQHPLKKLHRRLQRTRRLRIRQVWSVSNAVCVILCSSASVTWVCVFHQSCSGSRGCAAENESMDGPSHRQPLGFRRRPETCQSTHQRGKDTRTLTGCVAEPQKTGRFHGTLRVNTS